MAGVKRCSLAFASIRVPSGHSFRQQLRMAAAKGKAEADRRLTRFSASERGTAHLCPCKTSRSLVPEPRVVRNTPGCHATKETTEERQTLWSLPLVKALAICHQRHSPQDTPNSRLTHQDLRSRGEGFRCQPQALEKSDSDLCLGAAMTRRPAMPLPQLCRCPCKNLHIE